MTPLRILILSDGRPGHFNLSEGIAAAIERLGPATTVRQVVRRGRWPGAVLAALTRSGLPPPTLLRLTYRLDEASVPDCDVVVSAGAETLAASVWLARARKVPNVFYGSLRLFDPFDFTLVLTSYQRNASRPRHALALKPSRLDPDRLAEYADISSGTPGSTETTLALLIGGDAGPIRYTDADWSDLINLIEAMARSHGIRWRIANSRRTPLELSIRLEAMASRQDGPILQFLDARTAPPGTLPAILAGARAVLCTADSSSMLSECIWARRPTMAIRPESCPLTPDEAVYRTWLEHNGWCTSRAIKGLEPDQVLKCLADVSPLQSNPLDQLAEIIAHRIPTLRTPTRRSSA